MELHDDDCDLDEPEHVTAWENRQHFRTPPLVLPQNDVWGTSVEIPYWRRVNDVSTNQKHYPDLGSDVSSVWISAVVPP